MPIGKSGYAAMHLAIKYAQNGQENNVMRLLYEENPGTVMEFYLFGLLPLRNGHHFLTSNKDGIQVLVDVYPDDVRRVVTMTAYSNHSGIYNIVLHFVLGLCCIERIIISPKR